MTSAPSGTVTFLFTDIEGSTALWERWPDAMKAALARHHALLNAAAAEHHGYVFQIVGDAFCIAFGSAPDALGTALTAQRALRAETWGATGPLRVRMALHTGSAQPQDGQYASNRTFNRISRLLSSGYGGQILVTLATEELLRDHLPPSVSLHDLGQRRLRDVIHPERIFQVTASDLPSEFPPVKLPAAEDEPGEWTTGRALSHRMRSCPMVGRGDLIQRVSERLARLAKGAGGMMVVSGEPGIGKSRLLDELIGEARRRRFHVLIGRCHELDTATPYSPITDALDVYGRACAPETWQRLLQAAGPDLQVLQPDKGLRASGYMASIVRPESVARSTGNSQYYRPARGLRNLLTAEAQTAPVVFVVDDLHWADASTLELIHDVVLHTRDLPVLLAGSYREMELDRAHPLNRLLSDLNRERLLVREHLRRLNAHDTAELLTALLSGDTPTGLAQLVIERTDGNPFFIEELTAGLIDDGRLIRDDRTGRFALAPGMSIERLGTEVPQGVRAAIGARLDRLDTAAQHTLALASIIGRNFSLELLLGLAASHGLSADDVERALERATDARFVSAIDASHQSADDATRTLHDADYTFSHALIHQVVHAEIDRRERRRLHGEVGRRFEELHEHLEGFYAEHIAYHYLESDDDDKALQYSILAGDKMLMEYYDLDMALAYYLPALEVAISRDVALRRSVQKFSAPSRRSSTHRYTAGEREAIVNHLGNVLSAVRRAKASRALAQLASRICVVCLHTGEVYQASIRLYEQAVLDDNAQKLVVDTERGKLVGILEFPGSDRSYALVIICHGIPGGREAMSWAAARFHARGIATLVLDLPGYGETTVPLTQSAADAEILKHIVTAVGDHERVDASRVGIIGYSDGGWHAAELCARDERIRAMIGISGRYSKVGGPEDVMVSGPAGDAVRMARWKAGARPTPDLFPWDPDSSAFDVAHQIRCPALIVAGSDEPETFRRQAEQLASLVPTATLKIWHGGGHCARNIPDALEQAADWMKEQLKPATAR